MLSPMSSSMIAPAASRVQHDLHATSSIFEPLTTSIFILAYGKFSDTRLRLLCVLTLQGQPLGRSSLDLPPRFLAGHGLYKVETYSISVRIEPLLTIFYLLSTDFLLSFQPGLCVGEDSISDACVPLLGWHWRKCPTSGKSFFDDCAAWAK